MSAATAVGTRLSTTSEGLWLAAALAGVSTMPPVLKIRPVGAIEATLADHPGLAVLQEQGVCQGLTLDPDVDVCVMALGRPDVEIDIVVRRPSVTRDAGLVGPPPVFEAPPCDGPVAAIAAAEALTTWNGQQPPGRGVALCRRDGFWVSAARMWRAGDDAIDDVVVTALGDVSVGQRVGEVLGASEPADFRGINVDAAALEPVVSYWQNTPSVDVVTELARVGLTVPQARIVAAVGDATTTRTTVSAAQFSVDGAVWAPLPVMIADTIVGRVVLSASTGPDGRQWMTLLPGTEYAVGIAVGELLERLPSGDGWATHIRTPEFDTP